MSTDVRQTNPADEGADASAYICERCENETADAFAWNADAESLYTATGEVVRGAWYPNCSECNRAERAGDGFSGPHGEDQSMIDYLETRYDA